jgi:hypothetical protein
MKISKAKLRQIIKEEVSESMISGAPAQHVVTTTIMKGQDIATMSTHRNVKNLLDPFLSAGEDPQEMMDHIRSDFDLLLGRIERYLLGP